MSAGATSYAAIADWLRHCPQDARARLGFASTGALPIREVPSQDTIRSLLLRTSPQAWAALVTAHATPATRPTRLAADGKSARGSRTRTASAVPFPSSCDENALVTGQMRVPDKTNDIPCPRELYADVDLTGTWVTTDALPTQTETATFLVEEKKAHFLMTVKANRLEPSPK